MREVTSHYHDAVGGMTLSADPVAVAMLSTAAGAGIS
jgi:hypothetical protein